ncbi:unnamed protein product [Adineta steineri]|uniref:Uncharacterized protein n=2 Tax=Adineta steineri TaxID=433720 RepID=A0A818NAF9_9BILA|nr:unnamed protein product [Adineta steineri]
MNCSLAELKRLIVEKSSRSGAHTHHPKDDYDLIISNSTTHEEYKDHSDMIPRNTSVVVARRIRGAFESLTPLTNQRPVVSSDDIINEYLRPAIFQPTQVTTSATTNVSQSSVVDSQGIPLEMLTQSSNNTTTSEMSEDEKIREVVKTSQSRYLPSHRTNNSYTCYNCKQPGHIKSHCPLLLQSSSTNSNGNTIGSLFSSGDHSSTTDNIQSTGSGSTTHTNSHIGKHQSYHRNNHHHHHQQQHGNRSHHRGSGHSQSMAKNTTGIPRDGLIQIPRHIPGAYRDPHGASVVPRPMAQLFIEKTEKKADALALRARQFQEKGVLPPAPPPSMLPIRSTDEETPPDDLLCLLCKQIYNDAVITPCCHNSFCDECIRTALVESEDHECPQCHRQHVAIDQINPNLFLRKHVDRWREERQQKSSYSYMSTSLRTPGSINILNSNDIDEYDAALLSTVTQQSTSSIKTAPIVIKMQPLGRSRSPQSIVSTKPADMTFEDGKVSDSDQITSSEKDVNSRFLITNDNTSEEISNIATDINTPEYEKSNCRTPPSQVIPVNTIVSSPSTTTASIAATPSVIPHYYPSPSHIPPHQQHIHHGLMYPQQIPPTSSTNYYPMQPNYYPPPMHLPYPHGVHHPMGAPSMLPGRGLHHYPAHPSYPLPHHHSIGPPHMQPNSLNGYHVTHYETANVSSLHHHPGPGYAATSTSTVIAHHHQTGSQSVPTSIETGLSKNEYYMRQRHLQQTKRSTSRHRSRSLSYSSYTSSDSRNSSFSRRDDQHRRRRPHSSRSQNPQQTSNRRQGDGRIKSPNRDNYRQKQRSPVRHRSPLRQNRPRASPIKDNQSSKHGRSPPQSSRSTREREKRRTPRPPPTIQQTTQRTIVYMHESSSSSKQHSDRNRDHRRTRTPSKHRSDVNDSRIFLSSKTEQKTQSESVRSSSPVTVSSDQRPRSLASKIEPVIDEKPSISILSNSSNNRTVIDSNSKTIIDEKPSSSTLSISSDTRTVIDSNSKIEEKDFNNEKKRKKHHHHHHKKHRRHSSKSKKNNPSEDNDIKTFVDDRTSIIQAQ